MYKKDNNVKVRFTKKQIEESIIKHKYSITVAEVLKYWGDKGWKTVSGSYVQSINNVVGVVNNVKNKTRKKTSEPKVRKRHKKGDKDVEVILPKVEYDSYHAQLLDPRWKAFREFIFVVRGRKCEKCGATEYLQIHHMHYHKGCLAWEYTCKDMLVLCKDCHQELHNIIKINAY